MTTSPGTTGSPDTVLAAVDDATEYLLRTVAGLTPDHLGEASLLPGWSRGHVLAHVSRNADALVNALTGAREGRQVPMYASDDARANDIEDGAGRSLDAQLADLRATAAAFADAVRALPDGAWTFAVRHRKGGTFPAADIPWMRRREVEYHHVDLGCGYTPGHWPSDFVARELATLAGRFATREELPGMRVRDTDTGAEYDLGAGAASSLWIEGPSAALLAWLSGRAGADGLTVSRDGERVTNPAAEVPELPPMA